MRRLALVLTLGLLCFAEPARAGDAAAEALFRAGRDALAAGDAATACARFEESQRLEPAVGTVLNLAECHEQLGHVASAWRRYREARDRLPAGDERLALVEQRLSAIEARLPRLTVLLGEAIAGASVTRDGVELGAASLGVAVPVDPGPHALVVRAPGHAERSLEVELREGEQKEVLLDVGPKLEAPAKAAEPARAPSRPSSGGARTAGYVIGGIGLGALGASLVTGAMVLDRKSTVEDECTGKLCSRAGVDAGESGRTLSTVSTIAFAVGAVGVGVGAYLVLSADDEPEAARLEVHTSPGAASLRFGARF